MGREMTMGWATGRKSCSEPDGETNGLDCPGKVNGEWSEWSMTKECSCGDQNEKMFTKVRTCTNPPPAHGGKDCEGEEETCSDSPCCPSGWTESRGNCYKYFGEQMTFYD